MKNAFYFMAFALTLMTSAAQARPIVFTCAPETSRGNEVVKLALNLERNTANLTVDGKLIAACKDARTQGGLIEYGEAEVKITCSTGVISLTQNYDETSLDLRSLKLGLSDSTFMCD